MMNPSLWVWLMAFWASNTRKALRSQKKALEKQGDSPLIVFLLRERIMSPNRYVQLTWLMREIIIVVVINISSVIIAHLTSIFFVVVVQDDFLVSKPVKQHLAKYDKQLKKFNVSQALDTALAVRHRKTTLQTTLIAVFMWTTFNFTDKSHFICRQGSGIESQRSRWLS